MFARLLYSLPTGITAYSLLLRFSRVLNSFKWVVPSADRCPLVLAPFPCDTRRGFATSQGRDGEERASATSGDDGSRSADQRGFPLGCPLSQGLRARPTSASSPPGAGAAWEDVPCASASQDAVVTGPLLLRIHGSVLASRQTHRGCPPALQPAVDVARDAQAAAERLRLLFPHRATRASGARQPPLSSRE